MDKKILSIVVCGLLITTLFPLAIPISAGDEENPEITDEAGDVLFPYIDVLSGWFFEKPDAPDYLYISLKIAEFKEVWFTVYAVHWQHTRVVWWDTALHIGARNDLRHFPFEKNLYWSYGWYINFFGMPGLNFNDNSIGSIDREKGILTWRIPKSGIGDPQPGDTLTHLCAFTAQRFGGSLVPFGPFFRDLCDTTDPGSSKDYTIQY